MSAPTDLVFTDVYLAHWGSGVYTGVARAAIGDSVTGEVWGIPNPWGDEVRAHLIPDRVYWMNVDLLGDEDNWDFSFRAVLVPEPSTLVLAGAGMLVLSRRRLTRRG